MLCLVCTYLDMLEKITPMSLVFEGDGLLPFEVKSAIALTELELHEIVDDLEIDDKLLDSHLSHFLLSTQGDGEVELSASYVRKDHMLKIRRTGNMFRYNLKILPI